MKIVVQVLDNNDEPVSSRFSFGEQLTLAQALSVIQALILLSGGFENPELEQVARERISAEIASYAGKQTVRVVAVR